MYTITHPFKKSDLPISYFGTEASASLIISLIDYFLTESVNVSKCYYEKW